MFCWHFFSFLFFYHEISKLHLQIAAKLTHMMGSGAQSHFFPGHHFCIPRIPTFTKQFHTISHKRTLAQTLITDLILNPS